MPPRKAAVKPEPLNAEAEPNCPPADSLQPEPFTPESAQLISDYAEPIAIAMLQAQLPTAIRTHIQRILMSDRPEDRAQLQSILQQVGLVVAADALRQCLTHAVNASQSRFPSLNGAEPSTNAIEV